MSNRTFSNRSFLKPNGSMFLTVLSGNWANPLSWNIWNISNAPVAVSQYPDLTNDIFIQAATTITQTANAACKNLNVNTTADVVRLVNTGYIIDCYGRLRTYSGSIPGTNDAATVAIAGYLGEGTIRFKGSVDRIGIATGEYGGSASNTYVIVEVAMDPGITLTIQPATRLGHFKVSSGIALQTAAGDLRPSGNGVTPDGGGTNLQGTFLVMAGAKFIGAGVGVFRSSATAVLSFIVQAGAVLEVRTTGWLLCAQNLSLLGEVIMNIAGACNMPVATGRAFSANIDTFASLTLTNTGVYALQFNTTINTLLKRSDTAQLNLNAKTLSYGANADLQITASCTAGSELATSGAGVAIPRNLILDAGVVYNLGGATKNIRGTLTLGAGASITNGTLNQNQP